MTLNYRLFQKFKLLGYNKFNHLTKTSNTLSHMWDETTS